MVVGCFNVCLMERQWRQLRSYTLHRLFYRGGEANELVSCVHGPNALRMKYYIVWRFLKTFLKDQ